MRSHLLVAVSFGFIAVFAGCTDQEAYIDAALVRDEAVGFYKDEILQNLIRASNRELFVHVDISTMQPNVTSRLAASFGGGQSLNNTGSRQTSVGGTLAKGVVGIVSTASQVATRPATFSLTPERDNAIQLNLVPVYGDQDNVYGYYIQYLNLKSPRQPWKIATPIYVTQLDFDQPQSLGNVDSNHPPEPKDYVPGTLKSWRGRYYYIPAPYAQKFFELCMLIMERPALPEQNAQPTKQLKKLTRELKARPESSILPAF